jgi:hypothetical protein
MDGITSGPILLLELGDHWLGWSRNKAAENMHVFNNGIIIGKLIFSENPDMGIIYHGENLPSEVPPLSTGVSIVRIENDHIIKPFNVTNIYYGGDSVSDMQLLIAKAEGYLPSQEGVGLLSTVGYFPGNLTLFEEIKKIPFLVQYNLRNRQLSDIPSISLQKNNDISMIERLINVVPDHSLQYLGISAGYDSRFVLGILGKCGITPKLIHVSGEETELVLKIAHQMNLPCTPFVVTDSSYLSPEVYTLATDAQIYYRGGNYSCLRSLIEGESLFHMGHYSYSIIKNAYRPLIKDPLINTHNVYERFIHRLFIHRRDGMTTGLRDIKSLQYLKKYLHRELIFGNYYSSFQTKKEWANWYYYLHKSIPWVSAHMADLSYFSHPVYMLSDLHALMYGISSDPWSNYKHDRVRKLNSMLLPELTVPYSDGGMHNVGNNVQNSMSKVSYEYLNRFKEPNKYIEKLFNPKKIPLPNQNITFSFDGIDFNARDFTNYFVDNFHDLISKPNYSYWLKRAAVTVGYTLQFLDH